MKSILGFLVTFFVAIGCVSAEEGNALLKSENMTAQLSYPLAKGKGEVMVVVREDGHLRGKQFQVELRPNCGNKNVTLNDLEAMDVESACKVDVDSFKHKPKANKLSVMLVSRCGDKPKEFTFDLSRLCRD